MGADGRQDTTRVIITITDVNDNSPQFTLAHYTGQVLEASPQGTTVLTTGGKHLKVQASDPDAGDNSKLLYEIVEQSASRVFQVDALTGVITTLQVRYIDFRALSTIFTPAYPSWVDLGRLHNLSWYAEFSCYCLG